MEGTTQPAGERSFVEVGLYLIVLGGIMTSVWSAIGLFGEGPVFGFLLSVLILQNIMEFVEEGQ